MAPHHRQETGGPLRPDYNWVERAAEEIAAASGPRRDQMVYEFLRRIEPLCEKVAVGAIRRPGLDRGRDLEDAKALVLAQAAWMLDHHAEVRRQRWVPHLVVRGRTAVEVWAESPEVTALGGYVGSKRRQRGLSRTRARLVASLGREPSQGELLEAHNAARRASRADAARQGALASSDDLLPRSITPTDPAAMDSRRMAEEYAAAVDDDPELFPVEAPAVIARCIEECSRVSDEVAQVATEWLSWYPGGEPEGVMELSRRIGVKPTTLGRRLDQVRHVCAEIFAAYLGDSA